MRNSKLQQENEQHSLLCEQLSQENQQKALELKVNTKQHICPLALPPSFPSNVDFLCSPSPWSITSILWL